MISLHHRRLVGWMARSPVDPDPPWVCHRCLHYGMTVQAIVYAGWDPELVQVSSWVRCCLIAVCSTSTSTMVGTLVMATPHPDHRDEQHLSYAHIRALQDVNVAVRAGEVTCVLGETVPGSPR